MISRRNIRVKVMQLLYSLDAMENNSSKIDPIKLLKQKLDESRALFVYFLYFITEVCRYAEIDSKHRSGKNLPSAADLNVNTKLAGNQILWKILESVPFKNAIEIDLPSKVDQESDWVKKVYINLVNSEYYQKYIEAQFRDKKAEVEILKFIFTDLMLADDAYMAHVEEHFTNLDDDAEMMQQLILNYFQKPATQDITKMVGEEKWLFAKQLLLTVREKRSLLMQIELPYWI